MNNAAPHAVVVVFVHHCVGGARSSALGTVAARLAGRLEAVEAGGALLVVLNLAHLLLELWIMVRIMVTPFNCAQYTRPFPEMCVIHYY
jgi:hypothetical protein